jgi:hypothetical protein
LEAGLPYGPLIIQIIGSFELIAEDSETTQS